VSTESESVVGRCCTNPTSGRHHRSRYVSQCRNIAAAADPQGPPVEAASAVQGYGQGWVSFGCPGEPRLEVWRSLVVDLSVEGQRDVPLFGECPGQDVVAVTSCSRIEVGDNVVWQYDGGEEPH
jgi:hypothetical protein